MGVYGSGEDNTEADIAKDNQQLDIQKTKELDRFVNWGICTREDIKLRKIPNQTSGLIITKIENDSPLINSIEVNSIIIEAQKKRISSADDLNKIVKQVLNTNQKTILLVVFNNQNQRRYIGIKLK